MLIQRVMALIAIMTYKTVCIAFKDGVKWMRPPFGGGAVSGPLGTYFVPLKIFIAVIICIIAVPRFNIEVIAASPINIASMSILLSSFLVYSNLLHL